MKKKIVILGSTSSIGKSLLEIVKKDKKSGKVMEKLTKSSMWTSSIFPKV